MVREICMDHIVLVDVVGEGAFGQVYRGRLHFCVLSLLLTVLNPTS
jgi:hypothetical protein